MSSVVSVRGLRKRYGERVAVDRVSFAVERGEIFGLVGPNGSGKTTTVECVQGLRRADAGETRVVGRIGAQLQDSGLPDRIKVGEALELFAALSPERADWRRLLEQWGLAAQRDASFGSLSGGQRQRLFVALALVGRPDVVFLDEMTTGLDPAARRVAWGLIEALRERGTAVVLVTHFMEEAERLCDRLAVLHRGRIVAEGPPAQVAAEHGGGTRVLFSADDDVSFLERVAGARAVVRHGRLVEVDGDGPLLARVAAALVERGIEPLDLRAEPPSLEDAFLRLTGEHAE